MRTYKSTTYFDSKNTVLARVKINTIFGPLYWQNFDELRFSFEVNGRIYPALKYNMQRDNTLLMLSSEKPLDKEGTLYLIMRYRLKNKWEELRTAIGMVTNDPYYLMYESENSPIVTLFNSKL